MMEDPFLGTLYSEDYDEQVRPQRHAAGLRPFTGNYEIIVDAHEVVLAPSMKVARAQILERLEAAQVTPVGDESDALIRVVGVAPGTPDSNEQVPIVIDAPAYAWFAMRKDPEFHDALQEMTAHFRRITDSVTVPKPTPPESPVAAKRRRRPKRYLVRYALLFECARELWARDAEHAELLLQQDVGVLLSTDCLDRWTDDQTGYGWRLEEVALAEDAA